MIYIHSTVNINWILLNGVSGTRERTAVVHLLQLIHDMMGRSTHDTEQGDKILVVRRISYGYMRPHIIFLQNYKNW